MTFTLDDKQEQALRQVLEHALETLELEIRRTDHAEFKELLKNRREVLNEILAKLVSRAPALA